MHNRNRTEQRTKWYTANRVSRQKTENQLQNWSQWKWWPYRGVELTEIHRLILVNFFTEMGHNWSHDSRQCIKKMELDRLHWTPNNITLMTAVHPTHQRPVHWSTYIMQQMSIIHCPPCMVMHIIYALVICTTILHDLSDLANRRTMQINCRSMDIFIYFWKQSGDLRGWWVWLVRLKLLTKVTVRVRFRVRVR